MIVEANEQGGETNISSGWHAIEFLLWGQDRSKDGPGARPASDYTTAPNARRRAAYLRLTTRPPARATCAACRRRGRPTARYRAKFLGDPDAALRKIFRGIGALSSHELAGERMAVAFESKDQEDEHSCFSDNTNADVVNDLRGIRMVYNGAGPDDDAPEPCERRRARDGGGPRSRREAGPGARRIAGQGAGVPGDVRDDDRRARRVAGQRAIEEAIEAIEAQSELLEAGGRALDVKVGFEG